MIINLPNDVAFVYLLHELTSAFFLLPIPCMSTRYPEEAYDPRVLYSSHHHGMSGLIRRQYGMDVKKTVPLSMCEMKSGARFVDFSCLRGLLMGASFNCGNTTGGRRPRAIVSLRVRNVTCTMQEVVVKGVPWLVPSFRICFPEEKYDDPRGPRRVREDFSHMRNYFELMPMSYSYFFYALFMARGLFVEHDPISSLRAGQVAATKLEAGDYFVFCEAEGDVYYDALPVSTQSLSDWTRAITKRMSPLTGLSARPYRAHR